MQKINMMKMAIGQKAMVKDNLETRYNGQIVTRINETLFKSDNGGHWSYNKDNFLTVEIIDIQKITSEKTSLNQIPAMMKKSTIMEQHKNGFTLDYGGGKYNKTTDYLKDTYDIKNFVYDKFNRDLNHNDNALMNARKHKLSAIFCCNVLNVIDSDYTIDMVLNHLKSFLSGKTVLYIQVYEGDKTGQGKETTKGYQRNLKADKYLKYISIIFKGYSIVKKGNLFIIKCLDIS